MTSEVTDVVASAYPSSNLPDMFSFKLEDKQGRMHRFHCGTLATHLTMDRLEGFALKIGNAWSIHFRNAEFDIPYHFHPSKGGR